MNAAIPIALASLFAAVPTVEPLGFQHHADPEKVHLGEPFTYQLVVTHQKDQRFELELPVDLGAFEALDSKRTRVDGATTATTTFTVQLSLFELGKHRIPDLRFDIGNGEGQWVAPGLDVEGLSSLPADAEEKGANLYDIRPPEDVPVRTWRLLYALLATLAAAGLGTLLYRYLKRPRPAAVPKAEAPLPAHQRAIAALDGLRTQNLPGQGRFKEFYFSLSEILRAYLGARYGFEALESTSTELLASLRRLHTPGLPMQQLKRFVDESDLVKFAKATVGPDECKQSLELGYSLVYQTMAVVTPAKPSADAVRPRLP